mmetsp:Transcript_5323/g.8926  ORF Transcript_5323/g.8926 Transcript_5323/m.8926 type:complete len:292 (+) Transcript_5323:195-1070(+)
MSAVLAHTHWGMETDSHPLRKATHFEDISEILGRMALERREEATSSCNPSPSPSPKCKEPMMEAIRHQLVLHQEKIAELEAKLSKAEKAIYEKDTLIKMLEAENKHLSSVVDEAEANEHFKDMYESAPQKRTSRTPQQDKKVRRTLDLNKRAPISVRMPDNPKLGWAVSKAGVVMHRIMVEFCTTLNQLDGRRMTLKWSLLRRYSAFEKLANDLTNLGVKVPQLPPKSWFRIDPAKRQAQLHIFINELILVPGVLKMQPFRRFMNLTAEMAALVPGGSNRAGIKKRSRATS